MFKRVNVHFLYIALAAFLWGNAGLFIRNLEKYELPEMEMVFWRSFISAVAFGIIILFKDKSLFKIKLSDLPLFALTGIFSIVLFNYSYYTTMKLSSLSVAAVLLYTAPFFVFAMSVIFFKEKITVNKVSACVMAFLGCCFVSGLFGSGERISARALVFGLLTGFGYALYTIFTQIFIKKGYQTLTITFYVFFIASLATLPFIKVSNALRTVYNEPFVLLLVFLLAIFNTVLPYLFYTKGLFGVKPSVAPIIATLEPVVATVVGALFFSEAIKPDGAVGIILVLTSSVLLNKREIFVTVNAKLNLILAIKGKREDGYHLLDTVMQTVSISDTVTVKPAKELTVVCNNEELLNKNNIAYRAAYEFFKETGVNASVKIKVKKHIPISAGLGGGSADAAAVISVLDKLFYTNISKETAEKIALKLGADVPFFISGGTQRVEGIGEKLTPLKPLEKGYFLIIKDGEKSSTRDMYAAIDKTELKPVDTDGFVKSLESGDTEKMYALSGNSFAELWDYSKTESRLKSVGAEWVALSGSGPSVFGYFTDKKKARQAYKQIKKEYPVSFLARPEKNCVIFD